MYGTAQKFRQALRLLTLAALALLFAGALSAALLPFLIDGRTVRESFIRNLSALSGGPVIVRGPLRIASFATLTIEVSDVSLPDTPRLSPIKRMEATTVVAVARLSSLLRGKLEFKKISISDPRLVFRRDLPASEISFDALKVSDIAAGLADKNPVPDLELRRPVLFTPNGAHVAYSRIALEQIRLGKGLSSARPFDPLHAGQSLVDDGLATLLVKGDGYEVHFGGEIGLGGKTAQGAFKLRASLSNVAASRLMAVMAPWMQSENISVSGNLSWAKGRLALDGARIVYGEQSASGSLTLATSHGRTLLEGTLAYDTLDLAMRPETSGLQAVSLCIAKAFAPKYDARAVDLDLRISAEHLNVGRFKTGPLAMALALRGNRVNIDIAELTFLGGTITGRLDLDAVKPDTVALNLRGAGLDAQTLAAVFGLPLGLRGPVSAEASLAIPDCTSGIDRERSASGVFSVDFPSGGGLEGEASQKLAAVFATQTSGWDPGASSLPFETAHIDGTLGANGVDLKVVVKMAHGRVHGTLRMALPSVNISGMLAFNPEGMAPQDQALPAPGASASKVYLSGTADAPVFSATARPDLSH